MFLPMYYPGGGHPEVTYITRTLDTSNQSTYTFAAQPIGVATPDRLVVVCMSGSLSTGGGAVPTSGSIGGVSAVVHASSTVTGTMWSGMMSAVVPTGATGDIVVNLSAGTGSCELATFTITGYRSATPNDALSLAATSNGQAGTLNAPTGGVVVGVFKSEAEAFPVTWVGITASFDVDYGSSERFSAGFASNVEGSSVYPIEVSYGSSEKNTMTAVVWR